MPQTMPKIHFTSDTHFHHGAVIGYCDRPFASVEEMNKVLVENWNRTVGVDDDVYHLGDFSLGGGKKALEILDQLNGNIHLIRGNHEKSVLASVEAAESFVWIRDYYELKVTDKDSPVGHRLIVMSHYPFRTWNKSRYHSWHLHGHCHHTLVDTGGLILDVGVDGHGYAPVSYDRVREIMLERSFVSVDKHL